MGPRALAEPGRWMEMGLRRTAQEARAEVTESGCGDVWAESCPRVECVWQCLPACGMLPGSASDLL